MQTLPASVQIIDRMVEDVQRRLRQRAAAPMTEEEMQAKIAAALREGKTTMCPPMRAIGAEGSAMWERAASSPTRRSGR